jgi:hypothetical protein
MRSRNTFAEEMQSLGGIPGLLYEGEPPANDSVGRYPSGLLEQVYGDLEAENVRSTADLGTAGLLDASIYPFLNTGRVYGEFEVAIASSVGGPGGGRLETWIQDELGIDIGSAILAAEGDQAHGDRIAAATAQFGSESFGCYLPWHIYGRSRRTPWGMYFFLEPLIDWAAEIRRQASFLEMKLSRSNVLCLAFYVCYRHELFHFHVEWFSTRQEALQRRPIYRPYDAAVFSKTLGSPNCLEEALAQAVVLQSSLVANRLGLPKDSYRELLETEFGTFGPGYRDFACAKFGGPSMAHKLLAAQIATANKSPGFHSTEASTPKREYSLAPRIVPGYLVWLPSTVSRFQLATPRRKKLEQYLRKKKFIYAGPGPGDHELWKFGKETVQINYNNGECDLASLKAVAKVLGKSVYEVKREIR